MITKEFLKEKIKILKDNEIYRIYDLFILSNRNYKLFNKLRADNRYNNTIMN